MDLVLKGAVHGEGLACFVLRRVRGVRANGQAGLGEGGKVLLWRARRGGVSWREMLDNADTWRRGAMLGASSQQFCKPTASSNLFRTSMGCAAWKSTRNSVS